MNILTFIIDANLITSLTGLIGTLGGLTISYMTLRHMYNQSKHKIKVKLGKGIILSAPGVDDKKEQIIIEVANLGPVEYTVASVSIRVGRNSGGFFIPLPLGTHPLPAKLKRDDTCNFWTDYADTLKEMNKLANRNSFPIRAEIRDYAGNKFYSNWYRIKTNETKLDKFRENFIVKYKGIIKKIIP